MGKARKLKRERAAANDALSQIRLEVLANALRATCDAVTDARGADCLMYALVGADVLRQLGVPAAPVAGSAAWRVGPGAGDTICHSTDGGGGALGPSIGPSNRSDRAAMFHAWIEAADLVIDFTTWLLRDKAATLDAADGQRTNVLWCPAFVCTPRRDTDAMSSVVNGHRAGLMCYERVERIERMVLTDEARSETDLSGLTFAALHAYHAMLRGSEVRVVALDQRQAA